jgi:hypothetical protein
MRKFRVTIAETVTTVVDVEATNIPNAVDVANATLRQVTHRAPRDGVTHVSSRREVIDTAELRAVADEQENYRFINADAATGKRSHPD